MDSKLSVHHGHNGISKPPVHHHHHGGGGKRRQQQHGGGAKGIKVVYISSPMKLTASAEEFRAVVQELTGRDSNVADHDLAGAPSASSSSYSPASSFGSSRAGSTAFSPTTGGGAGAAGGGAAAAARAHLPPTMATANPGPAPRAVDDYAAAGAAVAAAAQPAFQSFQGMYDQTAGSLLYGGHNYW